MSTASSSLALSATQPRHSVNPALGFGDRVRGWSQQATCNKVWKIALPILLGVLVIAAIALVGGIIAIPIAAFVGSAAIIGTGAGIGAATGFLAVSGLAIYGVLTRYRPTPDLSYLKLNAANYGATPLGQFNGNNSVLLTAHAKETTEWKLDLIRSAKQSIELSGNYCGGPIFNEALDIMEASLKSIPNFRVHLIASTVLLSSAEQARLRSMEQRYPNFHCLQTHELLDFSPTLRTRANHVKLLVVDEEYYVVGGTNLFKMMATTTGESPMEFPPGTSRRDRFFGAGYRDMDIVAKGELARTLRIEFFKLWAVWEHKMTRRLPQNRHFEIDADPARKAESDKWAKAEAARKIHHSVRVKALVSDPDKPNAITDEYARLIRQAKKVVTLANYLFNPAKEITEELHKAAKKKIKVRVITNGVHDISPPSNATFVKSNYPHYLPLLNHGRGTTQCTEIYEYAVKNIMYHKKFGVFDDETIMLGSGNFGPKSNECDFELNLVMESPEIAREVTNNLETDIGLSRKVTFAHARRCFKSWMGKLQSALFGYFN